MKRTQIYPGHIAMTEGDVEKIDQLNKSNRWGIAYGELLELAKQHKKARARNNIRVMECIEYRLTDINFHKECGMLARGEYDKLISELEYILNKREELKNDLLV